MDKPTVLYFGHKNENVETLADLLKKSGTQLKYFEDHEQVMESATHDNPVAIFINVDDFAEDAWNLCSELKDDFVSRQAALILLSENDDENTRIRGLESGADDFISLPFSPREVVARMKAISRRIQLADSKKIKVKDIEIDLDGHRVSKGGKQLDLTYIQFKLLYLLASRRNNVFSRQEILERVWGKKVYVTNRTVDVHIKRLREKLGEYKYPSQYIETIHGTGYRFL